MITKKTTYLFLSFTLVFLAGYILSSALLQEAVKYISDKVNSQLDIIMARHFGNLNTYPYAKSYFLLPERGYSDFIEKGPSFNIFLGLFLNAVFNVIFQPAFFCVLTPQTMLNYLVFPFFLFGAVKYFRKAWFLLLVYLMVMYYAGLRGSVIEVLIRHRMSCDLIYLLIGTAGFISWTGKG
jgi:hypothetical protein